MGKIQELHALLDDSVSESDLAPALRIAQSETARVAEETGPGAAAEALEISRLLIRLGTASGGLKGAILAGRAYGALLGRCAARMRALGDFYHDFGRSAACLLQVFAEGGSAVWDAASLEFSHASVAGVCLILSFCLDSVVDALTQRLCRHPLPPSHYREETGHGPFDDVDLSIIDLLALHPLPGEC